MADLNLTQKEADALLQMEKRRVDAGFWKYPSSGGKVVIPLISCAGHERFHLDMYRGHVQIAKGAYQTRARKVIVLARLDFGGAPHRNPNDEEVPSPHLHLYKEGYGDKWAYPVPDEFADLADPQQSLRDFMRFCNVVEPPVIRWGLL